MLPLRGLSLLTSGMHEFWARAAVIATPNRSLVGSGRHFSRQPRPQAGEVDTDPAIRHTKQS